MSAIDLWGVTVFFPSHITVAVRGRAQRENTDL